MTATDTTSTTALPHVTVTVTVAGTAPAVCSCSRPRAHDEGTVGLLTVQHVSACGLHLSEIDRVRLIASRQQLVLFLQVRLAVHFLPRSLVARTAHRPTSDEEGRPQRPVLARRFHPMAGGGHCAQSADVQEGKDANRKLQWEILQQTQTARPRPIH